MIMRKLTIFIVICVMGVPLLYAESSETISGKQKTQALRLNKGTFVNPYVIEGFECKDDEVMVGVHIKKKKAICASLNFNYRVSNRTIDDKNVTQVSSNPKMHGCARNFFIQGLKEVGFLGDKKEKLVCVSLETENGIALEAPSCVHDGRGPYDKGTQSDIYGLTPTMHACPKNSAMNGIHQSQNDLHCCE